jgi:hypothetical protein
MRQRVAATVQAPHDDQPLAPITTTTAFGVNSSIVAAESLLLCPTMSNGREKDKLTLVVLPRSDVRCLVQRPV